MTKDYTANTDGWLAFNGISVKAGIILSDSSIQSTEFTVNPQLH